jgi:P-type Cu2+ transporter
VVFDKTGTLTMGAPVPEGLETLSDEERAVARALADGSSHPLSRALADAARDAGADPAAVTDIREVPGYGVEGRHAGRTVRLGRAAWVGAAPVARTATWLDLGEGRAKPILFADTLRPGAEEAVAALRATGKRIILMSGDTSAAVAAFAGRIGIDEHFAEALPAEKAERIRDLTADGHRVLMVGDGLNDTAALAAAHVSISPASALDAARVASDIVLLGRDLAPVADAVDTGVRARRRIKENFALSTVYNVVAVPFALLGFATPFLAALAMSASSITVSLNALRLR